MARRSVSYTKADVTRALQAIKEAGVPMERFTGAKITREAATLFFGNQPEDAEASDNPWDEVLDK